MAETPAKKISVGLGRDKESQEISVILEISGGEHGNFTLVLDPTVAWELGRKIKTIAESVSDHNQIH